MNADHEPSALPQGEGGFEPPAPFTEDGVTAADNLRLAEATLRQLEKDFALQGIALDLPKKLPSYPDLLERIAGTLNRENRVNGERLIRLLYQMDIDEAKMRILIAETPAEYTLQALANRMVRRCLEKVITRRRFS